MKSGDLRGNSVSSCKMLAMIGAALFLQDDIELPNDDELIRMRY